MNFGREECEDVRLLGNWVGDSADVRNRVRNQQNYFISLQFLSRRSSL